MTPDFTLLVTAFLLGLRTQGGLTPTDIEVTDVACTTRGLNVSYNTIQKEVVRGHGYFRKQSYSVLLSFSKVAELVNEERA